MGDLLNPKAFRTKLEENVVEINWFSRATVISWNDSMSTKVFRQYMGYADQLKSHIVDTVMLVNQDDRETEDRVIRRSARNTFGCGFRHVSLRHLLQFNGWRRFNGNGRRTNEY